MEPISDFWFYKFISPTTKFSTPLSDFHVKSMCAPTALTRGVREASSIPSFQSMTHQSLLPCSHDRALLGSRGWTERPRNPPDILLEFFIGPSFHKAICKTSKMIAANHCNTEYVQHSSTESTTRDHVDKGLDGSAFLSMWRIYLWFWWFLWCRLLTWSGRFFFFMNMLAFCIWCVLG